MLPLPEDRFHRYGYQSFLTPAELYRRGLRATDEHARGSAGAAFADLGEPAQEAVVEAMAEGEATGFDLPSASGFFELLRRHTIEGVFADPIYGGNRDLVGWELIGYPGAQRAYTAVEVRDPSFRRPPQGLTELHAFNPGQVQHGAGAGAGPGRGPTFPVAGSERD